MNMDNKHGFKTQKLALNTDFEGKAEATLIYRKSKIKSSRAVLYVHGFVDYFFQSHLADWANDQGLNFYAVDLRKHGRSILPHQKPNMTRDLREYFEEFDMAIGIIRKENDFLVMIGHSTGGLSSSLYAHYNRKNDKIDGLILNSPFFDFNKPPWFKKNVLPIVAKIGLRFPNIPSPEGLKTGYSKSIHKDYNGDWDFDLKLKPKGGFKVNFGWIAAIYYAQKNLQSGLKINCPTLVMYSDKSVPPGRYQKTMHSADSVLNVQDIETYADTIGDNVSKVKIKGGVHDLLLSNEKARNNTFAEMTRFIKQIA